jgi:hypothetical protein
MSDINFSEMNQKMRQSRKAHKKNPSRMSAKQPARTAKVKPGIAKLSRAATKGSLAKLGARVVSRAAAPVAVAVTAYETGKAIHAGVKAYKAKKHLARTKAHTQKHYATPEIAAATRKRKTGK